MSMFSRMRLESERYSSFVGFPPNTGWWPSRLAGDGFYFIRESGGILCFSCSRPPPDHAASCSRALFNVPLASSAPPPPLDHTVVLLLVYGVAVSPLHVGPDQLGHRMLTLHGRVPPDICRALAEAGFYYDVTGDRVECFSCGLQLPQDLLNMAAGGPLHVNFRAMHSQRNPDCAFLQQQQQTSTGDPVSPLLLLLSARDLR